ncbi:hypothetical protein ACWDG9_04810 [Streptomyces sp. NPDC001073]
MQFDTTPDLGTPHISVPPGTVLGHRKDGRPIYAIAGGSGEGEGGGSEGGQGNEGGNDTDQDPAGQQGAQGGGEGDQDGESWLDELPDKARKEILRLRREAASNRVKAKNGGTEQSEQLQKVLKALGLETDGDNADQLNEKLTAAQTDAKQRAVELAVYKAATKAGADPDALLDSRAFLNAVSALDHTGDTFDRDVLREVREAAKSPKYRTAPARSGGNFGGSDSDGDRAAKAEPGRARLSAYYAEK